MCNYGVVLLRISLLFLFSSVAAGDQVLKSTAAMDQTLKPTAAIGDQMPVQCPVPEIAGAPRENKRVYQGVTVLIGADVLGRIAVAADYDGDEYADEVMLFITTTRLTEPAPVLVEGATVRATVSSLVVEAPDRSVAIALSLGDPYKPPSMPRSWRRYSQTFVNDDGMQFSKFDLAPAQQQHLTAYDHNSIFSWPPPFHEDKLYSGTASGCGVGCSGCSCSDIASQCDSGGCYANGACSCNSPCSGGENGCVAGTYPCCRCEGSGPDGNQAPFWCFADCIECGTAGGN